MGLLCDLKTLKTALVKCNSLLSNDILSLRGVPEDILDSKELRSLRGFLDWLIKKIDEGINSFESLIKELERPEAPTEYKSLMGFLGKILDAIQVVKPTTLRYSEVVNTFRNALSRSGHEFLLNEYREIYENYIKELVEATASFLLLEVVLYMNKDRRSNNPIASLRKSMGDRLPEEYFAELLAGWFVEDVIKKVLEEKSFSVKLTGVDRERKIFFSRPRGMGEYDLEVVADDESNKSYRLEVQRVGKISRYRGNNEESKENNKESKRFFYTELKQHKYRGGGDCSKVLTFWIGQGKLRIERREKNKSKVVVRKNETNPSYILFVPNIRNRNDVNFEDKKVYISEDLLIKALPWEEFKRISKEQLIQLLSSLCKEE